MSLKPPRYLKAPGRAKWRQLDAMFEFEDHHLLALQTVCLMEDRARGALELLDKEGLTTRDARGSLKPHPAIQIEKDARALQLRALRELSLDSATAQESRPPRIAGGKRYA
jgi:P27 family predicted phage terminase small subunit